MSTRRPSSRIVKPAPAVPMTVTSQNVQEWARASADGELNPAQQAELERQLAAHPALQAAFKRRLEVLAVVSRSVGSLQVSPDFDEKTSARMANRRQLKDRRSAEGLESSSAALSAIALGAPRSKAEKAEEAEEAVPTETSSFTDRLGVAPWWAVSVALHVLVIVLLGLVTMSIGMLQAPAGVIVLTSLEKLPRSAAEEEKKVKSDLRDVLQTQDTPPTDPDSQVASNIVVPPEILAQAELGDHFETINLDRPDTHSAFGNPEARMFHSVSGNDEPEGGGGNNGSSLMDDLIGMGGSSSPGTGGGWGGGNGTGTGIGNGAGHGSFGQRNGGGRRLMVMRHGGSKATESSVDKALEWLAKHQEADGHWDTMKYQGGMNCDPGNAGLALLAFLGAGHTEKVGKYKDNVRRAVAWIISIQQPDGEIGKGLKEPWHQNNAYYHAICGLALAEASGMARQPETVKAAQLAIDHSVEKRQGGDASEKTAWRYDPKKDADTSVSGWFVMQLKSARIAGLQVNPASFEGALKFYDSMEIKENFNGYPGGRFRYHNSPQFAKPTLNTTSIGMLSNLFLGRKPDSILGGAEFLSDHLPRWDPKQGEGQGGNCFPMYYHYYGTLVMFQMGSDYWKKWNDELKKTLVPKQIVGGDADGSWDPMGGADDKFAGRVYMTAMGALCLEVYYRYLPITKH